MLLNNVSKFSHHQHLSRPYWIKKLESHIKEESKSVWHPKLAFRTRWRIPGDFMYVFNLIWFACPLGVISQNNHCDLAMFKIKKCYCRQLVCLLRKWSKHQLSQHIQGRSLLSYVIRKYNCGFSTSLPSEQTQSMTQAG